jgi:hypothetical protein
MENNCGSNCCRGLPLAQPPSPRTATVSSRTRSVISSSFRRPTLRIITFSSSRLETWFPCTYSPSLFPPLVRTLSQRIVSRHLILGSCFTPAVLLAYASPQNTPTVTSVASSTSSIMSAASTTTTGSGLSLCPVTDVCNHYITTL